MRWEDVDFERGVTCKTRWRQLDQVVDRDLVLTLLEDMNADDRADLLMIIGTMRAVLAMTQIYGVEEALLRPKDTSKESF